MMYRFISRGTNSDYTAQMRSQLSSAGGKANTTDAAGLLQSMGFSGMQGRTVREMAQYQMRVQQNKGASAAQQTNTADAAASAQRFSVREQYTSISDEATEAMQKLALEDAKNSAEGKSSNSTDRAKLIREQLKGVDPSKRAAAFNTMNKVWESETERIGKYIKEKDANWNDWGDKFDTKLLDDYKAGVNIWV